jgi:hypothetical protein
MNYLLSTVGLGPQIGMANARAMQFEATRTDPAPDAEALRPAGRHARHACALDPHLAEAWASLGLVLERTGRREAALERAVTLEPDNGGIRRRWHRAVGAKPACAPPGAR